MVTTQTCFQERDRKLAQRLLRASRRQSTVGQRMKTISARFLGFPYQVNPLIGSAQGAEVFVARLDGFDCVTFMETVLAFAWAKDVPEFLALLREIRYAQGQVSWLARHHYATDWARQNIRRGFLRNLTVGEGTLVKQKRLDILPGLRPRMACFRYFPKRKLGRVGQRLTDGDLIFFVSTRPGLDVFHTGLIFRDDDRLILRHAARSRGGVVEQELAEFVGANRMPGFIIMRPREKPDNLKAR